MVITMLLLLHQNTDFVVSSVTSGQSYKASTLVIYDSRVVRMSYLLVNYDSRVVIYERKMFIRLAIDFEMAS